MQGAAMSGGPFIAFYPSDWLGGTRMLSALETGVYITLVAMMYEAEGPIQMPHDRLARSCGTTLPTFRKALETLIENHKIIMLEAGLWNDRVERELKKREQKRESAKVSANHRWQKTEQKQSEHDANALRPQYDGNANHNHNHSQIDTNANALDGDAVTAALWDRGVRFLVAHGSSERQARSVIGKWRKDAGDQEIYDAFAACKREGIVDPIPWVTASLAKPKVDLQKIMQEMIDELTSGGPDQTDDRVPQQEDGAEDDRWQRRGAEGGDSFARPRRDEARAPRQLADVVAGVRGRAARSYEDARLADPERN